MTWSGILGHDAVVEHFRRSIASGRLASTYLFVGPAGIGKRMFAVRLAQALLCDVHSDNSLQPCGRCASCQQVEALTHPDLQIISKPDDKSELPLELFIGDREHRMREGLCHHISLKPYGGRRKIAIIDDADYLNQEGANCLLKTLEEPPPASLLILIGTSEQRQLPTIRSRCQVIRFAPLSREDITALLLGGGHVEDRDEAARRAELSEGSLAQALAVGDPAVREFRERLFENLGRRSLPPHELAKSVLAFVEEAGTEASARRSRLRLAIRLAASFYRELSRILTGLPPELDSVAAAAVQAAVIAGSLGPLESLACLERCLDAESHVEANAQPATIIECWFDDLASLAE